MNKIKGCWFWIDASLPEEDQKISVLCDRCRNEKYPGTGCYWDFKDGCGKWDIICGEEDCKTILYKHEEDFTKDLNSKIDDLMSNVKNKVIGENGN